MNILSKRGVSGFVEIMLTLIMIGGSLIWLTIPWSLTRLIPIFKSTYLWDVQFKYFIMAVLYITGAPTIFIVYEIRKIFKSINEYDPFIYRNVKSLNRIGYSAFFIALVYVVKIFLYPTILTIVVTMIFIIAGFFGIVLAEVFRLAVIAKQENDLTI